MNTGHLQRLDLYTFMHRAFLQLNPHVPFLHNWHNRLIAAKLEACRRGDITRLIIVMFRPDHLNPMPPLYPFLHTFSATIPASRSFARVMVRTSPTSILLTVGR